VRSDLFPLSPAQQRLWFLHELNGGSPEYHIVEAFRLRGELDVRALERSLTELVARHESLRAAFVSLDGEPRQYITPPRPIELTAVALPEERVAAVLREEWQRSFDLAGGLLLRPRLLRTGADEHVLVMTVHHIASDGWSQGVLRYELEKLYNAFVAGKQLSPRGPAGTSYTDHLVRHRGHPAEEDLAFWREELAGLADRALLPPDRAGARGNRRPAPVFRSTVDPSVAARLREAGRAQDATLHMTLLAAYAVLLARHGGRDDFAIGTPVAHRFEVGLERLVALLVDMLALRVRPVPGLRFADLLAEVRRTALAAYEHQRTPFEQVVEELAPQRRLDRTPLFQATFSLQTVSARPLGLAGLEVTAIDLPEIVTRFDLELHALDGSDLTLVWVHDGDVLDDRRVELMARHYVRLLERIAEDPGARLEELWAPVEHEQEWLLGGSGQPESPGPGAYELFSAQVRRTPEAVAVWPELTYAETDRRAGAVARHLESAGVAPGDRVAVRVSGADVVPAVLGVLRCGAFVVADASFVLTEVPAPVGDGPVPSGAHAALASRAAGLAAELGLEPADRVLAASVVELLAALATGAVVVPAGDDVPETLRRAGVTVAHLDELPAQADLGTLRQVLTCALPPDLCRDFRAAHPGVRLWNTYGVDETAGVCAIHDCSELGPDRLRVPVGRPVGGVVFRVLDERMALVPRGVVGELHIGGGAVAGFGDGALWPSGEAVRWTADGQLEHLGRMDVLKVEDALWRVPGVRGVEVTAEPGGLVARVDGDVDEAALLASTPVPVSVVFAGAAPASDSGSAEESLLCGLFAEVLGREEVGGADNFFALGGHSLLALKLIARVYEATGVELSVRDVFEVPTPAELAALVKV
jgi:non-ribosomal peptide synthetase component F/acyl carrier protein